MTEIAKTTFKTVVNNTKRTQKEIQNRYAELCGIAGDKQYKVMELKAQLDIINEELFSLNKEFNERWPKGVEDAPSVEDTKTP